MARAFRAGRSTYKVLCARNRPSRSVACTVISQRRGGGGGGEAPEQHMVAGARAGATTARRRPCRHACDFRRQRGAPWRATGKRNMESGSGANLCMALQAHACFQIVAALAHNGNHCGAPAPAKGPGAGGPESGHALSPADNESALASLQQVGNQQLAWRRVPLRLHRQLSNMQNRAAPLVRWLRCVAVCFVC